LVIITKYQIKMYKIIFKSKKEKTEKSYKN